jgi:hypothetical protein
MELEKFLMYGGVVRMDDVWDWQAWIRHPSHRADDRCQTVGSEAKANVA